MSDFPRWKYALVIVVLALGILYAVPNIFQSEPAVQVSANRGATVDQALETRVRGILQEHKIAFERLELDEYGQRLLARFANPEVQLRASDVLTVSLGDKYVVALNLASTVPPWLQAINANS